MVTLQGSVPGRFGLSGADRCTAGNGWAENQSIMTHIVDSDIMKIFNSYRNCL